MGAPSGKNYSTSREEGDQGKLYQQQQYFRWTFMDGLSGGEDEEVQRKDIPN